jgi:hypothetical protein
VFSNSVIIREYHRRAWVERCYHFANSQLIFISAFPQVMVSNPRR